MSDHNFPTPDFIALGKEIKKGIFIIAERECLAFFKESFDKGGFTDVSFQKWEDRKQPDYRTGGALLNATGFLKDSIEVAKKDSNSITFGSYAPYAKIHNEGGIVSIPLTPKMKKYFWAMFKKTNDSKWKYMALSKKNNIVIKFPKRQFMGHSTTMMKQLDQEIKKLILEKFRKLTPQ